MPPFYRAPAFFSAPSRKRPWIGSFLAASFLALLAFLPIAQAKEFPQPTRAEALVLARSVMVVGLSPYTERAEPPWRGFIASSADRFCDLARARPDAILAIDQESAPIHKFKPAPIGMAGAQSAGAERFLAAASASAQGARARCVNLILAPVFEFDMAGRSFSGSASERTRFARIALDEHRRFGIFSALKHFPFWPALENAQSAGSPARASFCGARLFAPGSPETDGEELSSLGSLAQRRAFGAQEAQSALSGFGAPWFAMKSNRAVCLLGQEPFSWAQDLPSSEAFWRLPGALVITDALNELLPSLFGQGARFTGRNSLPESEKKLLTGALRASDLLLIWDGSSRLEAIETVLVDEIMSAPGLAQEIAHKNQRLLRAQTQMRIVSKNSAPTP